MKLRLSDYFWSVGGKTKKIKTLYFPLEEGIIEGVDPVSKWRIDRVEKNYVLVSVIRHDGETIKTLQVEKGRESLWRPRSFDGGHIYKLKLVRFF